MNKTLPNKVVAALCLLTICAGCVKPGSPGFDLPPQPDECLQDTPHAPLIAGQDARTALARERLQLDVANASKRRCADHYEDLRNG